MPLLLVLDRFVASAAVVPAAAVITVEDEGAVAVVFVDGNRSSFRNEIESLLFVFNGIEKRLLFASKASSISL